MQAASLGIGECHHPSLGRSSWENDSKNVLHISAWHSFTGLILHVVQSSFIDRVTGGGSQAWFNCILLVGRLPPMREALRHGSFLRLPPNFLFLVSGPLFSERINICSHEAQNLASGPGLTRNLGHALKLLFDFLDQAGLLKKSK
jgi:hypothetical protein